MLPKRKRRPHKRCTSGKRTSSRQFGVLLEPTPRVRGVGGLKAPDAGDWTHARQRPAPPTPRSCSDQPKALWLATCANRIRVSLTYIVARGGGTLSRARHVSIGVRLIFCEIGVALCILKIAPNFLLACDNCDSLAPALEHPALAMLAAIADARRCVSLLAAAGLRASSDQIESGYC